MSLLKVKKEGAVLELTLDRPEKKNALTVAGLHELKDVLMESSADSSVRVVTITGSGTAFCAGADVDEWAEAVENGNLDTYGWSEAAHAAYTALYNFPKPTVAIINGIAVGGGMDMALACDLRLASEKARFIPGYTQMAYAPDAGASWHLPRLVGVQVAKAFLYLDQAWDAQTALKHGLVLDVYSPESLSESVAIIVEKLAKAPTLALMETKALIAKTYLNSFEEQLAEELKSSLTSGHTNDAAEAVNAFKENRRAHFTGA